MLVPSKLVGGLRLRIGPQFFHRLGAAREDAIPAPRGLVSRIEDLSTDTLDARTLAPEIQAFFLDPDRLDLAIVSEWQPGFRLLWRFARPVLGLVGQFHLPWDTAQIKARTFALDAALDGRAEARAVVREYRGGQPFQTVAYTSFRWKNTGYLSTSFPLPFGALFGLLRLEASTEGSVLLTSRREGPDDVAGLWFFTGRWYLPLPFEERFFFWPAPLAPKRLGSVPPGCSLVAEHRQFLLGRLFVRHTYHFSPQ